MNTTLPTGDDEVRDLAEKIARAIHSVEPPPDLAALHTSINKINHRLEILEGALQDTKALPAQKQHPSLDKLSVAEAIADSIFGGRYKEKACQFEPDKPCDHCSMCSSRGF